jgi:hypothetical protein
VMGGGNFVVPAQCVTDFISNKLSGNSGMLILFIQVAVIHFFFFY